MVDVCFYFQVHQPLRLRPFTVFEIGKNSSYFDDQKNREILDRVAKKCYMPANAIILAAALTSSVVTSQMNDAERLKKIAPFFLPAPGATIEVDPKDSANAEIKDQLKMTGWVKVLPPKGACFIITKQFDEPDIRVCEPRDVSFRLEPGRPNSLDAAWGLFQQALVHRRGASEYKPSGPLRPPASLTRSL